MSVAFRSFSWCTIRPGDAAAHLFVPFTFLGCEPHKMEAHSGADKANFSATRK
jgi:hypothetical protein